MRYLFGSSRCGGRTLLCVVGLLLAAGGVRAQAVLPQSPPRDTVAAALPVAAVPDSLIEARLRGVFANVDEFEQVQVEVGGGVVHLSGSVLQAETSRRAEALAARLDGVLYVDNDIETATDVETRITPAVARVQEYWDAFVAHLPVLGVALFIVLTTWLLSLLIGRWTVPRRIGVNPLVWGLVRRLLRGVIFLVGLLLAFDILGITAMVGAVLGTAGVVGLAIGFAFQDIVENYLAGMLLSLRRPFGVNDLVRIGEYEGRVIRLTSRELLMLTFEGNHVRLPNAMVFKSALTNFSLNPRRLFHFEVGVDVNEDLQRAMAVGVRTLQAMKGVLADPLPFARVQQLGESSVTVRFHAWVDQQQADFLKARSEAIRVVKVALDEAGIEMPEPIYQVRVRQLGDQAQTAAAPPATGQTSAAEQARAVDVTPDRKLDAQVREEIARSDEENLLSK